MSPRGGPCNHQSCADYGEGCRQLTDEELEPDEDDVAFAQRLIDEGYLQTSAKYRNVCKPSEADTPPSIDQIIRPEMLDTPAGKTLAMLWEDHLPHFLRSSVSFQHGITLTVKQFRAYKKLGGGPWPVTAPWRRR